MSEGPTEPVKRLVVVSAPGAMTSAVIGCCEAFQIANLFGGTEAPRLAVSVASASGTEPKGFGGVEIPATAGLDEIAAADAVVIPPIIGLPDQIASANRAVVDAVAEAASQGVLAAAACTGTFLLAETGALDGRRATTTPQFRDQFQERYPAVHLRTALRVIDEGAVVTAGATTSYLDLALRLVARMSGPRVAVETARFLSVDANPRSQQPFLLPLAPKAHADEEIRKAEQWVARHLAEAHETADLARVAGLGERTFLRRFRDATGEAPRAYVQRLRVQAAMRDLEGTQLSIEQITNQCGYADVRSFRRLFRSQTGISPAEYRKRFGHAADASRLDG